MADGSTTLLYRFLGIDEGAGAQFDRMAGKTAMLGESSTTALSKLKALTIGGAIGVAVLGVASLKMASDYQKSMTLIQTQAGASKAEVDSFSKSLLSMAGQVASSPEALSVSLYHVYSALKKVGATAPQMLNTVRIAAEGAKVGNTDLESTTNSLTATLASGIVKFNQAGKAMGYLNAIVGAGDMKFSDLNQALGTGLLVTMKTFGVSMQDTGAALAVFGDNNIRGAEAATKLRMAVQDIAKPASGNAAADAFAKMNLNAMKLRSTLENQGLNAALILLKNHLEAAGITGSRVGGVLADAFTKKAGTGLAILLTRFQQFDEARQTVQRGADGFGAAWQATTQTLAFAFDRLKAEAEAAMITLGQKLIPAVTSAADWLGTNLPAAVSKLQQILSPLEHTIGTALVLAWKALAAVVKVAADALSAVGDFLASHRSVFTDIATAVLAMWAAFKGYTIARLALWAVAGLVSKVALGVEAAAVKVRTFGSSLSGMSTMATVGTAALAGVGIAFGVLSAVWQENSDEAARAAQAVSDYYGILQQSKGVINDTVVGAVAQKLAMTGVYDAAAKYGLDLQTVTQAALGNAAAQKELNKATYGNWDAFGKVSAATDMQGHFLHQAQEQYRLATGQTKQNTTANLQGANSSRQAALAARQQSAALAALTKSLQTLINTEISQLQTVDGFKLGLLQLTQQVKNNGHSLSDNTQKGLNNRDALLAILASAEKAAEGSKNYGKALEKNVGDFMAAAKAAGFHGAALHRLLGQADLLQKQISKRLTMPPVDTSSVASSLTATIADASYIGAQMGTAFNQAFKRANGIASPSKVFRQYGIWIVQGLINGVKSYTVRVRSVARELALGLVSGWKDGTSSLNSAFVSPVQRVLGRLQSVVDNAISRQQTRLKTSQGNLASLLKSRTSAVQSLSGTVSSSADLSNLFGTDVFGNPSTANINTFLSGQASTIENFAKDLKWGAKHGLAPQLLAEIAGLGADQGDQVLKQFMSGGASIRQANASEAAIQRYSTLTARTAEDAVYAKRVAADRKAVRENTVELRHLTRALHAVERQAAREAAVHVTIDAKTGKPVVDRQFTLEIIRAIRKAQRVAGKKLI